VKGGLIPVLYTKVKLSDDVVLIVPIYDDEIYTICPECGVEHAVDPEIIAHMLNEGDDFASASVYCEKCSKKETVARIATAQKAITLNGRIQAINPIQSEIHNATQ
jgi:hypothetical protein